MFLPRSMSQFGTSDWAQLHRQVLTGQGLGTEKALDWGYIGVINRDYVRLYWEVIQTERAFQVHIGK